MTPSPHINPPYLFSQGRYILYSTLVNYLYSIYKGSPDKNALETLSLIPELSKDIDKIKDEEVKWSDISNLLASEYIGLRDYEKGYYRNVVNQFYIDNNYKPDIDLPPDHLIVQLAFMARLIEDGMALPMNKKIENVRVQHRFLKVHILRWLENYKGDIKLIRFIRKILSLDRSLLMDYLTKNK